MIERIKQKDIQILIYALLEKGVDISISLITGIVVTRFLTRSDYGIMSTISSYAFVFSLINICPENYFFKSYNSLRKNELNRYFKSYFLFDVIDGLIICLLYVAVGGVLSVTNENIGFVVVAISSGVSLMVNQVYNISRIILELKYKQKMITKVFSFVKVIRLIITCLLVVFPSLYVIAVRETLSAVIQSIVLFKLVKDDVEFKKTKINIHDLVSDVKKSLIEYSFLSHITGVLTGLIYNIDPIILSLFVNMNVIGTYSIALNSTNYFIFIFQVIQKNAMIQLGNSNNKKEESLIVSRLTVVSVLLGIIQLIAFVVLGKYYMMLYVTKAEVNEVFGYALWILLGLTVFNMLRPISSYLILKYDIRKYFIYSVVPSFILTMVIYFLSAMFFGANGIAVSNFIAYSFWSVTQLLLLMKSEFHYTKVISNCFKKGERIKNDN